MKDQIRNTTKTSNESLMFQWLETVVEGIALTFGSRCEVILHDLKNLDHSIIKIMNGHVTGRTEKGSITDMRLQFLKEAKQENLNINYPSTTKDGRLLKSSSIVFRNHDGLPVASICINFDISDILSLNLALNEIFTINKISDSQQAKETFNTDIESTLTELFDKTVQQSGKSIPALSKEEKIEIVRRLEKKGAFLIKGAIKLISTRLNVSKFTIYNYLEQIRSET